MGWLARFFEGYATASSGHPVADPAADVRARIATRRLHAEERRDLGLEVIRWRWDGRRWARWSVLSRAFDQVDLPVPDALAAHVADIGLRVGDTYELVDGTWVPVTGDPG